MAKRGLHFSFSKRAGRHQKGAGCSALQKRPRQNTASDCHLFMGGSQKRCTKGGDRVGGCY